MAPPDTMSTTMGFVSSFDLLLALLSWNWPDCGGVAGILISNLLWRERFLI
jgi:hypothetical protein